MKPGIDYIGVAVGAMVFNQKGELFLSKRSQQSKNERGCWEIPGGSVEFGEKLQDAIKREVKEEFGVEITILEQFPAADHIITSEKQHWVPTTFLASIVNNQEPRIMELHKCDGIGWFALDNLPAPLSIITQIDLAHYLRQKKVIKARCNMLSKSAENCIALKNKLFLSKKRLQNSRWII